MQPEKTQTQSPASVQNTFSAELGREDVLRNASFENTRVSAQHKQGGVFRGLWVLLVLLLLASLGFVFYVLLRSGPAVEKLGSATDEFKTTRVDLEAGATPALLNGQLSVNGNQLNNGDLTVLGSINGAGDLNIGGNTNVGGTLSATVLQGSLNANFISGVLGSVQLDPFIAYTNKDLQVFFGNNQIFRNSTNSNSAFQIQNAASSPILSVATSSNFVGVNTSTPSLSGLSLEVNGIAKIDDKLLVGAQSSVDLTILNAGALFGGRDIDRTITSQREINNNSIASGIYSGLANELLVDPSINPTLNNNFFSASYSALETEGGFNYPLNGGALTSYTHNGTGNVDIGLGQITVVNNKNTGSINRAIGHLTFPTIEAGSMNTYVGFEAFNPQLLAFPLFGLPPVITGGSIDKYFGIQVLDTSSASPINQGLNPLNNLGTIVNANISSEGTYSQNFFEGKVQIGICSNSETSAALCMAFEPPPGGNKLLVNPATTADTNASTMLSSRLATDKTLVVQGTLAQTGNLSEWQNSTGTALSVVDENGNFGVQNSNPLFALHAGSAAILSGTTVARFENAGGTCDVTPNVVGAVTCTSDIRVKKNISEVTDALTRLGAITVYNYNLNTEQNTDPLHVGFLAQELESVLPDLVVTDKLGMKSVSYAGLTPYLVQAIKQQQAQIEELKNLPQATTTNIDILAQLADAQAVIFGGDVTVNGNVIIKGHIVGNANTRGTVTILAGQKSASVGFSTPYSKAPKVVVSPTIDAGSRFWVSTKSVSGFSVELETSAINDVQFDWQVQE